MNKLVKNNDGFSIVQLIVAMVILLLLAAATFAWIDPLARIGEAKNKKRTEAVNVIAAAISDYASDHRGNLPILGSVSSAYKRVLCSSQSGSNISCSGDSKLCLTLDSDFNKYLATLPIDPNKSSLTDTGYYLQKDVNNNLTVGACDSYDSEVIIKQTALNISCAVYGGGYCWYDGGYTTTCDSVCAAVNLECIKNVTYDSDVDINGDPFCSLNQEFYPDLSPCVIAATSTPSWYGPYGYATQKGVIICSQSSGALEYPICACE